MQNLKQMAEIICAANRAAGLGDGFLHLINDDPPTLAPSGDSKALAAMLERIHKDDGELEDLCSVYPDANLDGESRCCIVPIKFYIGSQRVPTEESDDMASLREGEDKPTTPLADRVEAAESAVRGLGKKADAIADHLRSIGFFVEIKHKEGAWNYDVDHTFKINGALILPEAVTLSWLNEGGNQIVHNLLQLTNVPGVDYGGFEHRLTESPIPLVFADIDLGTDTPDEFVRRVAVTPDRLRDLVHMWDMVGHSVPLFAKSSLVRSNQDERVQFLVSGLLPVGSISLLAAKTGAGKSTLAHELSTAVAATAAGGDGWSWLGQPINREQARGVTVFLAGEDSRALFAERGSVLDPTKAVKGLLLLWVSDSRTISDILQEIRNLPAVDLIVIDPLIKYVGGDENESRVVDRFYTQVEDIAKDKSCAVLVVHHLSKGARPVNLKGPGGVIDWVRGSGTIVDRARVAIGMYRDGDVTRIGIGKSNMPPSCGMIIDPMAFKRDPATLRHARVGGGKSKPREIASADESASLQVEEELARQILTAVRRVVEEGKPVTKSGKHELHGHKAPELDGLSRAKIRAGTDALIAAARLVVSDGWLSVAESEI
jgi:hypothetical protein